LKNCNLYDTIYFVGNEVLPWLYNLNRYNADDFCEKTRRNYRLFY